MIVYEEYTTQYIKCIRINKEQEVLKVRLFFVINLMYWFSLKLILATYPIENLLFPGADTNYVNRLGYINFACSNYVKSGNITKKSGENSGKMC